MKTQCEINDESQPGLTKPGLIMTRVKYSNMISLKIKNEEIMVASEDLISATKAVMIN